MRHSPWPGHVFSLCTTLLLVLGTGISAAGAEIVVRDFSDREVRLAIPANRIVALSPHIAENVFSAGAGDKLVGTVGYSDYPEQAINIPRVGNFQSWSLESLVFCQYQK